MAFEEVETGLWKPESKRDCIEGVLIKIEQDVGANNSNLYTLEVDNKPVGVWGSAILDPKMVAAKIGDLMKIEYDGLGEAKSGHSAPKLFKVFIDYDHRNKQD